MFKKINAVALTATVLIAIAAIIGCQNNAGSEGFHVMFEGSPNIYHPEVYYHGKVVGKIQAREAGTGTASRVTVLIEPQYSKHAGRHWAFYVDHGRLFATRLISSGASIGPGDRVSGFHSKAALNWFKIKTLLGDRISKAGRRAEKLYQRLAHLG